jgi:hypothetical protein
MADPGNSNPSNTGFRAPVAEVAATDKKPSADENILQPLRLSPGDTVKCSWSQSGGAKIVAVCSSDSKNSEPAVMELEFGDY